MLESVATPLLGSGVLGDDGSLEPATWGHTANSLLAKFDFETARFYCETSVHERVVHFKSSLPNIASYGQTGTGSMVGLNTDFTLYGGTYG